MRNILHNVMIKLRIILTVFGIHWRARFRILMEHIMRRMNHIVAYKLVRLPEIIHFIVNSGV